MAVMHCPHVAFACSTPTGYTAFTYCLTFASFLGQWGFFPLLPRQFLLYLSSGVVIRRNTFFAKFFAEQQVALIFCSSNIDNSSDSSKGFSLDVLLAPVPVRLFDV